MYGVGCSASLSNHLPFESWSLLLLPDKVLHYSTESALFAKFIPARHAVVEVSVLTRHKASKEGIKEVPCLCVYRTEELLIELGNFLVNPIIVVGNGRRP